MNKNYIGENIRIFRERKNITQRELGDMIGKTWEMVSRYERGISSPMKQIGSLADALEIDVVDLMKDPRGNISNSYSFNRVPLFISIPKDMNFRDTKSYIYYTVPDWVLDIDRDCFVIDSSIVNIEIEGMNKNGRLYISPNSSVKLGDTILNKEASISKMEESTNISDVLGKVLAQEIVFD